MKFVEQVRPPNDTIGITFSAHHGPFSFTIFDDNSVVWSYGYGGEGGISSPYPSPEAAKRWCYDFALKRSVTQLMGVAPPGARVSLIDGEYMFVCGGCDPDMGYWCNRPIGHPDDCWAEYKNEFFTPVKGKEA